MSYNEWVDGYAVETTFKDNNTLIAAGNTAYSIGAISQESQWPSPEFTVQYSPTGVNAKEVAAGLAWKTQADLRGMLGITVQNGIPIWLAMGNSSTAGAGPYTHTITPYTDGTLLPSVVFQHEEKGTATAEEYQFQGVKIDSLMLSHDMSQGAPNVLLAKIELMAAFAEDPGFALTNKPALPATATTAPYSSLTRTWDYGAGNTALNGLRSVELTIVNGLQAKYAHSYDTGVYTGQWPYTFVEAPRKYYHIRMMLAKTTIERALWTELITLANTKELYFKWTKSTNDYIAVTCTNCKVKKHTIVTPAGGDRQDLVEVEIEPEALSFSVVDSIAGGAYGD